MLANFKFHATSVSVIFCSMLKSLTLLPIPSVSARIGEQAALYAKQRYGCEASSESCPMKWLIKTQKALKYLGIFPAKHRHTAVGFAVV